jgi:hypothetical protein
MSEQFDWLKSTHSLDNGTCVEVGVPLNWRKSTQSNGSGDCVEVAECPDAIHVRDSKNPTGASLVFTVAEWRAFVVGAKDGEFDI